VYIARAMNHMGDDGLSLWNQEDGFFYDVLHLPNGERWPLRVRSMVGLIPLYAIRTLDSDLLDRMPAFKRRMEWFIRHRPDLTENLACMRTEGMKSRRQFSVVNREQLQRILDVMLDEHEFLSEHGIRAVSKYHESNPYVLRLNGGEHSVHYEPGESSTGLFGGNSNWRGPIWFPVNYLLLEALRRFAGYYGGTMQVECPTGSGHMMTLDEVADEVSRRLVSVFKKDAGGRRPVHGERRQWNDPHWRDLIQFHEYFHGDSGAGIGAGHQTGWTALVANMIHEISRPAVRERADTAAAAAD
jgi:hypothetical protein